MREDLLATLGDEVLDANEETFDLFSRSDLSQNLGMLDPGRETVELSIAGRDFTIAQSPGILQSRRDGGTTGAALWQTAVRFAEWIEWPQNPLWTQSILTADSVVLELGSGISGLVPCVLSSKVGRIVPTDQPYILNRLRENIAANATPSRPANAQSRHARKEQRQQTHPSNIDVVALDWESDDIQSVMCANSLPAGVDCIFACDCIYNYALIDPFTQTCADLASLAKQKGSGSDGSAEPTLLVVAQHLRQPDVFEQWLVTFLKVFRVWRLPTERLTDGLKEGSGFAVHLCVLRTA